MCLYIFRSIFDDICQEQLAIREIAEFKRSSQKKKQRQWRYSDYFSLQKSRLHINQSHKVQIPSTNVANTNNTEKLHYFMHAIYLLRCIHCDMYSKIACDQRLGSTFICSNNCCNQNDQNDAPKHITSRGSRILISLSIIFQKRSISIYELWKSFIRNFHKNDKKSFVFEIKLESKWTLFTSTALIVKTGVKL